MAEGREIGWYERVMKVVGLDWCERRSFIRCLVNVSGKPIQLRSMLHALRRDVAVEVMVAVM